MKRLAIVLAVLAMSACSQGWFTPAPTPTAAVEITAVSFDWSNTIWENIKFTVKNTGTLALDGISVYYTAECAGGNFDHLADFPSIWDMNGPLEPGSICYAGTTLATLTGGARRIVVKQVKLEYSYGQTKTLDYSKVFTKP